MWPNPVEFAGLDQGRDDGPVLYARIVHREERVFPVQGNGTDGALDRIIIELDAAIAQEQGRAIQINPLAAVDLRLPIEMR